MLKKKRKGKRRKANLDQEIQDLARHVREGRTKESLPEDKQRRRFVMAVARFSEEGEDEPARGKIISRGF